MSKDTTIYTEYKFDARDKDDSRNLIFSTVLNNLVFLIFQYLLNFIKYLSK